MPAQVRPVFRGGPLCRGLREMECNGAENAVTAIPHANVSQQGTCPMTGPFHACRRVMRCAVPLYLEEGLEGTVDMVVVRYGTRFAG